MKLLFHAFPRARHVRTGNVGAVEWIPHSTEELERGFLILGQILRHGILCTPERFAIYADPETERDLKAAAFKQGEPYTFITQSRACFTLMDRHELSQEISQSGVISSPHYRIFGPFAIGIDPLPARSLGVCPVFYYYRHLHGAKDDRIASAAPIGGLGSQIVSRLMEIATVFSVLSRIEAIARPQSNGILSEEMLDEIGITPAYEPRVEHLLAQLSRRQAADLLQYFDTDRVAAWNIVDFVNMLLSFYQSADSTLDGTPLAFFNQREWRLVYHTRGGLNWIGLGDHPYYRDPNAFDMFAQRDELKEFLLSDLQSRKRDEDYFLNCWALNKADGLNFRDFIKEIVVPPAYVSRAEMLLHRYDFKGKPPAVYAGTTPWRLVEDQSRMTVATND